VKRRRPKIDQKTKKVVISLAPLLTLRALMTKIHEFGARRYEQLSGCGRRGAVGEPECAHFTGF
jgi:hypothetical protein